MRRWELLGIALYLTFACADLKYLTLSFSLVHMTFFLLFLETVYRIKRTSQVPCAQP